MQPSKVIQQKLFTSALGSRKQASVNSNADIPTSPSELAVEPVSRISTRKSMRQVTEIVSTDIFK
jgi:hypothetical protein